MINDNQHSKDLSFAKMMSIKNSSRDRQVDTVYTVDLQMLEWLLLVPKPSFAATLAQSPAHNDFLRLATDARSGKRRGSVRPT
ncbi:hypothetical protein [Pseudomonas lijiangensis]|uniref:Uncharacterized protein n=1 Tax=Pseudomonas lijiangensis TaxID=2995658 RepID=A0ABX8HTL0_9PSED|nr:hypothetical protein [Pseudomonas lijiangensis]MBX8502121.1 hypothetical protein [Pseudomonas lijiangensis]MBX8507008.1 hypothetical protein [Pseudomonas lijiangensis]QWU83896.1 hypothetical protein KQP88_03635 [Pseudomonas lijiangensis]